MHRTLVLLITGIAASTLLASVASAAPLPLPRWEIEYDLTGTTLQVTGTPLGLGDGNFALWGKGTNTAFGGSEPGVSPGNATLELTDCGGAICFGAGNTPARLSEYFIETHFNVAGVGIDFDTDMEGELIGNYDGSLNVNWTTLMTDVRATGNQQCEASALICGLAGLNVGANPLNRFGDQPIGAPLTFNINTANPFDVFSDFVLPADPSGSTKIQHLRGVETNRTLVVPEPGTALLLGLGLVGVAISARSRKK